jgi:tetratricopeptide (TPR) repeat protein
MYADLLEKGYACLRRGDPNAAISRFQHAASSEPERPHAYFALAQAYLEQGLANETGQALEQALAVDPHYVPARAYLGLELFKRYDLDGAQEALDQALRDEPTNLLVHTKYAEYYYRLGFYPRAVEMLERGLKGPHGANEQVVAMAHTLLTQARQKSKGLILREPPDPRNVLRLFARFWPTSLTKHKRKELQV